MRAIDLNVSTRGLLAPVCRECTWWQTRRGAPAGPALRHAWERDAEAEAGFFGRALLEGDALIGYMQVAAPRLVPRARCLPAGPPSPDAYLLMCSYFHDEAYLRGFQFLLQEIEASLKHRGVHALEAFGHRRSHPGDPFHGYLRADNLFHPEVLEGLGFRIIQRKGEVARFRLELAAIVEAPRRSVRWKTADGDIATQAT
jgi:hypothetical protein